MLETAEDLSESRPVVNFSVLTALVNEALTYPEFSRFSSVSGSNTGQYLERGNDYLPNPYSFVFEATFFIRSNQPAFVLQLYVVYPS